MARNYTRNDGGGCPTLSDALVDVIFQDGVLIKCYKASDYGWQNTMGDCHIAFWRYSKGVKGENK